MINKWTTDEIKLLIDLYINKGLSLTELYPIFHKKHNRTKTSVNNKIKRLKLKHTKNQRFAIKSRLNSKEKNGMFGRVSPMKGLTKENSDIISKKSKKLSETRKKMYKEKLLPDLSGTNNPMYGKTPWCFGLTKENNDSLKSAGKKISTYQKNRWNKLTKSEKSIIIKRLNEAMIQGKTPTKIEEKMKIFLNENNIKFKKNKFLNGFYVDFYLTDYDFVIECDGDYWHANPKIYKNKKLTKPQIKNKQRDYRKNKMLNENKIKFLRFWESDIKNNFNQIKKDVLSSIVSIKS